MGPPLQYKVVELSTVDESSLEDAVNHWVRQGWNLDGVQFAMRESSKRPSMAFVFFTRSDLAEEVAPDPEAARARLHRLAGGGAEAAGPVRTRDPWQRLAELAGEAPEGSGGDDPS